MRGYFIHLATWVIFNALSQDMQISVSSFIMVVVYIQCTLLAKHWEVSQNETDKKLHVTIRKLNTLWNIWSINIVCEQTGGIRMYLLS